MKKNYFIIILFLVYSFNFGNTIKSSEKITINFYESIGKSKIHLQKISIIYMNLSDGKKVANAVNEELYSIEKHLKSLKIIVKTTKNRSLKNQLKNVETSFKGFKKLAVGLDINHFEAINKQQMIIQFQLNNLYSELEEISTNTKNTSSVEMLKSNIVAANRQVLNLKKYKFNQKMFTKTQDEEYLIDNKEILNELRAAIDKLIIASAFNTAYNMKLGSLKKLVNYMQYNESHMKTVVDDASVVFERIRDDYSQARQTLKTN